MEGWIKLHRKIIGWDWYNDANTFRLFLHLLLLANSKEASWRGMTIKRGDVITGRKTLSTSLKISEQAIRTSLKRLESTKEITIKSTNKYSIITICKYGDYQTNQPAEQPTTNQQTTNKQPTNNHKQEYKNNKNIKGETSSPGDLEKNAFIEAPRMPEQKVKPAPEEQLLSKINIQPEYREAFVKWLRYKRKKNQSYKDEESAQIAFNKLKEMAKDPETALKIVEHSMGNNYSGLFAPKENTIKPRNNGNRHRDVSCVFGGQEHDSTI